jgi:NADPH2:quinone reductase
MGGSAQLKAVVCRSFGPPPDLVVDEVERPALGRGQARIAVHACGANFPDTLITTGSYQLKLEPPFVPGGEVAGVVSEIAPDVKHIEVGDRVIAITHWGGYAEEIVVDAEILTSVPKSMDLLTAAGFVFTYGTSYHALVQRAQLSAGDTLLVLGAAGGVGLAAVEIGRALGADVIAVASSEAKRALARRHGAREALDYVPAPLKSRVMVLTRDHGADVIFDPIGGEFSVQALRSVAWNGRFLVVGFATGTIPAVPLNLPLLKGCSIVGVFWGDFVRREPDRHQANCRALFDLHAAGELSPAITEVSGLDRVAEAIDALRNRRVAGKLVVRIAE